MLFLATRQNVISETIEWIYIYIYIPYILTAIRLSPGGSGYFTYKQNMKLVTTRFKSGGLHDGM